MARVDTCQRRYQSSVKMMMIIHRFSIARIEDYIGLLFLLQSLISTSRSPKPTRSSKIVLVVEGLAPPRPPVGNVRTARRFYTQVVTDVDDTLKSSGGVNVGGIALGGIDVQYARGESYPGVPEFMLQVSLGPTFTKPQPHHNPHHSWIAAKPAILTARADEFKLALELKQDNPVAVAFREAGERVGIVDWGLGPVLYGSVAEWIVQDRKGLRKFNNFERLLEQDPSGQLLQYIFVGDVGELDQEAGETMLREYPEVVQAVFLHVVSGETGTTVTVPPPKLINGRPVVFFRTYVGAAVAAVQLGLCSLDGLECVIEAAQLKLKDTPRYSDKWIDLERDMERANKLILAC